MTEVARFGGGPDDTPEVSALERKYGSQADVEYVQTFGNDKVRSALALWTAGATYGDIAAQLQLRSARIAELTVERALSEQVDDASDKTKMRRRMGLTLDRFLKAITAKALDPTHPEQLPAVRTGLSIVDRLARLYGLDEAVKVDLRMPGNEDFQRFVAAAATGMGLDVPVEGDPFADIEDAEVIEDDDESES